MTPEAAEERMVHSRQMLDRYKQMVEAGTIPVLDLGLMFDELRHLERIAGQYHDKTEEIRLLGEDWLSLMAVIRGKLN